MATFPTAAEMQRPIPQAGASIPTARPTPIGLESANAMSVAGQQFQELAVLTDRFAQRLDDASAQDALNKLAEKRAELTADPEKGFARLRGKAAMGEGPDGQPIAKSFTSAFDAEREALGSKLSPRARAAYEARATREGLAFKIDLVKHQTDQADKYETATYAGAQAITLNRAAQSADDDRAIGILAGDAGKLARKFAIDRGMDGPAADAAAAAAESDVLKTAATMRIAKGDSSVIGFFEKNKDRFDAKDRRELEAKVKSVSVDAEGDTAAASAFGLKVPEAVKQYDPLIQKAAATTGVRPALLIGAMAQESGGNPKAVSSAGAGGLMQIMPGTAKDLGVTNVFDPEQAIPAGARYLKQNLDKYDGNERLALMAYNWGPGSVDKWIKTGADPEKVPRETRDYVQKVQGYALGAGSVKVDAATAKLEIMNRPDLSPAVKANAFAKIERQAAAMEAFRTSSIKGLDDKVESVIATVIANPASLQEGTFQAISDQYKALGRPDEATRYALLAPFESTLKQGLGAASESQVEIFRKLFKGLPQQLLEGLTAGNGKARAEASSLGSEKFAQLKKSVESDGIKPTGLVAVAKEAISHFAQAGKPEEARKVSDFMAAAFDADKVASGSSVEADRARADMIAHANAGQATAHDLATTSLVAQMIGRQKTLLAQDAFKNGATIYAKDVGPVEAIDFSNPENVWQALDIRSTQARKIAQLSGNETIPFTGEEIERFRGMLDKGTPEGRANLLKTLSRAVPDDMKTGVAVALAGKKGAGDETSQMYAAAMANYGSGDPVASAVADKILSGANILKNMGEGGRKPASTSDGWTAALQDKLGNALALHKEGQAPAELAAAIKAHYVASMWTAGQQGEKTDTAMLDKSIDAVTGGVITYRGQNMFAPAAGATVYNVEAALRTLTPADIPPTLRTQEGDPITADAIARNGRLVSVGQGVYAVRIPDPRAGGDLRPILDPTTGKAFVLDLRPLLERTRESRLAPDPAFPAVVAP